MTATAPPSPAPDGPAFRTLLAIAGAILPEDFPRLSPEERREALEGAALFARRAIGLMASPWRQGVLAGLAFFEWSALAARGRRFSALSPAVRESIVDAWAGSRLGPRRDLMRLARSLLVFHYYDSPPVRPAMERESAATDISMGASPAHALPGSAHVS